MRQVNYQKREILEIEWDDIVTRAGWHQITKKNRPAPCRSVGYFNKQTKNSITMSLTVDDDSEGEGCDVQTIPNGCIKRIHRIKRVK